MLSDRMQSALNEQVNAELFSSYLYLSMASWFRGINLNGFARWVEAQALEELYHAIKIYNYINERSGQAIMTAIDGPQVQWSSPLTVFEDIYQHELKVSGLINGLVDIAIEEHDHATNNFLQWYVAEQVEEESSADEVVKKLKLVGEEGNLFMLDQEMGTRVFNIPVGTTLIAGGAGGA